MSGAFGFEFGDAEQGVIFRMDAPARYGGTYSDDGWTAELISGVSYICLRGGAKSNRSLDSLVPIAQSSAENVLDLVAVETRQALLVSDPHNCLIWRKGIHGLKVQLTTSITFKAEVAPVNSLVHDASGAVKLDDPYVIPQHHDSFRYFRYSQAASNVFDGYRNMFLALESILDYLAKKQEGEGEAAWLARALEYAVANNGLAMESLGGENVQAFVDKQYSAVRCAVFHAKSSKGGQIQPGMISNRDFVLKQLLSVQAISEKLLKSVFDVRLPSAGFYNSGFGSFLEKVAPIVCVLISEGNGSSGSEVLAGKGNPRDLIEHTRFLGLRSQAVDEWLFESEVKCKYFPGSNVGSLRLISRTVDQASVGVMGIFLTPIIDKMNETILHTDLDILGVTKLVARVRCILRNAQDAQRGFAN